MQSEMEAKQSTFKAIQNANRPKGKRKVMQTPITLMPILCVDLQLYERNRIIACLNQNGFGCTDEQSRLLLGIIGKVPHDKNDESLWNSLKQFIVVDAEKAPREAVETQLRELQERWKATSGKDRRQVERQMLVATEGLDEHPEWFDGACLCDSCKSCA